MVLSREKYFTMPLFQFAVNTYQSIISFHITLACIFMLPTVKPLLGVFIKW